jgi:hypothetical protein
MSIRKNKPAPKIFAREIKSAGRTIVTCPQEQVMLNKKFIIIRV